MTPSVLVRGHDQPRVSLGTAHAAKFFVRLSISLVFLAALGFNHAQIVLGLMTGGVVAAPFAA